MMKEKIKLFSSKKWKFLWLNLAFFSAIGMPIGFLYTNYQNNLKQNIEINKFELLLEEYQLNQLSNQEVNEGNLLLSPGFVNEKQIVDMGITLPKLSPNLSRDLEITSIDQKNQSAKLKITTKTPLISNPVTSYINLTNFSTPLEVEILAFEDYAPKITDINDQNLITPGLKSESSFANLEQKLPTNLEGVTRNFAIAYEDINWTNKSAKVQVELNSLEYGEAQTSFVISNNLSRLQMQNNSFQAKANNSSISDATSVAEVKNYAGAMGQFFYDNYTDKIAGNAGEKNNYRSTLIAPKLPFINNNWLNKKILLINKGVRNDTMTYLGFDFSELRDYGPYGYRMYINFTEINNNDGVAYASISIFGFNSDIVGESDSKNYRILFESDFDRAINADYEKIQSVYLVHTNDFESNKPIFPDYFKNKENKQFSKSEIENQLGITLPDLTALPPVNETVYRTYTFLKYHIWDGIATFRVDIESRSSYTPPGTIKKSKTFKVQFFKGASQIHVEQELNKFNNYHPSITNNAPLPNPKTNITQLISTWNLSSPLPDEGYDIKHEYFVESVDISLGIVNVKVIITKNSAEISTIFQISGFHSSYDDYLEQASRTLNNQTFVLKQTERTSLWGNVDSLNSSQIKNKLNSDIFTFNFPSFDESVNINYEIIEANEDTGINPGYLKIKAELSSDFSPQVLDVTFTVANFLNQNENIIKSDLAKLRENVPNSLSLKSLENTPSKGEIVGSISNLNGNVVSEGLIFDQWNFQNFTNFPDVTPKVTRTFKVSSADFVKGEIILEIIVGVGGNFESYFIKITNFRTAIDDLLLQTTNLLQDQVFNLKKENRISTWWTSDDSPTSEEIENKLRAGLFETNFPVFDSRVVANFELIDVVTTSDFNPGYLLIKITVTANQAIEKHTATFKINNFYNDNELLILNDISFWENIPENIILANKEDMPIIGDEIGYSHTENNIDKNEGAIFNWEFSNLAFLPNWNSIIKRRYKVIETNSITGEIVVEITISAGSNSSKIKITISNFETPYEKLLKQSIDALSGKNFELLNKEEPWLKDDQNINDYIKLTPYTMLFPTFDSGIIINYEISDIDTEKGILIIKATIDVGEGFIQSVFFTISNFKTADEIEVEDAIEQFDGYIGKIGSKIALPQIGLEVTDQIYDWDLNVSLPALNPNLTYHFTIEFTKGLEGSVVIKLEISKNDVSDFASMTIQGFSTSQEMALEKARNALKNKTFSLSTPEIMWNTNDSDLLKRYILTTNYSMVFPTFDNGILITYNITNRDLETGTLTLNAHINAGSTFIDDIPFKIDNFKTNNQLALEEAIAEFSNFIATLTSENNLPTINTDITDSIYDWNLDIPLPNKNPDLDYIFTVSFVQDIKGEVEIQVRISKDDDVRYRTIKIKGFKSSRELIFEQAIMALKNKEFKLLIPEKIWETLNSNELYRLINNANYTTRFPILNEYVLVTYSITKKDEATGVLTINANIKVDETLIENVSFKISNFKTTDLIAIETAIQSFEDFQEATLLNKEPLPRLNQDLNSIIYEWELDKTLPSKNSNLNYAFTVSFVKSLEGMIKVQVYIFKDENEFKTTTITIKGFKTSADDLILETYENLNLKSFSLEDSSDLGQKQVIWDDWKNMSSEDIKTNIDNSDFKANAVFPTVDSNLNIEYRATKGSWNKGTMNFSAQIKNKENELLEAKFAIENFQSNEDLMQIAFDQEEAKLRQMQLIPKTNQIKDLPGFENTDFTIEWPLLTKYNIYEDDGSQIYSFEIERDYETKIDTLNNQINLNIKLSGHPDKNEGTKVEYVKITFDNKKQSQMANIFLIAFGVQVILVVIIWVFYLIKKRYVYVYLDKDKK